MSFPEPHPDQWAVVTGASQGIGRAIAVDLARDGYNLILVARRADVLRRLAGELHDQYDVDVSIRVVDLGNEGERKRLVDELAETLVSIIVNSAGIASFGAFKDQDWAYESQQFELNARAVFELTHAVLPGMLERGDGCIINVGSAAGNIPIPNNATYVLTKAGVNAFTEALHYELKGTGVTCTLLAPGPVREAVIPQEEQSIVDKVVPDFLWTTYESCSKETLAAARRGQRRVVPGPLSKAMNAVSQILPTAVISPVMGWFYAKMGS